jgi:hypothetical protein
MLIAVVADTHGETDGVCQHLKQWKPDRLYICRRLLPGWREDCTGFANPLSRSQGQLRPP